MTNRVSAVPDFPLESRAAVPAAIFYNHFLNRIKALTGIIDRFSLELINLVERHYIKANV